MDLMTGPLPQVNWHTVSAWLGECDSGNGHKTSCRCDAQELPVHGFRVMDTKRRCVVLLPVLRRYATLSYVWGNDQDSLRATKTNVGLSATINDAINACCHLQIPFLWVDRLCIVQDELSEKAIQLDAMGSIYSQSYVTLVAMAGEDAEYGLPGTDGWERPPQWTGEMQGIHLLKDIDQYTDLVANSKWRSRGWTFQEAMLSSRLLIFTDHGAFYQCHGKSTVQAEEELSSCGEVVKEYTARDLTHKSDIINAFSGILHSAYGDQHYYGFPFSRFHWALLWVPRDGKYPERCPHQPEMFPSWSWSSIDNAIDYWRGEEDTISASLAQWAIPPSSDGRRKLKILRNTFTEPHQNDEKSKLARLAVLMAWKGGCFPGKLPRKLKASTWGKYDMFIRQRWQSLACMCDEAQCMPGGLLSASDQEARFPLHIQRACLDGCILAYTQSQRLELKLSKNLGISLELHNAHGDMIAWSQGYYINREKLCSTPHWNNGAKFDVLALSMPYHVGHVGRFEPAGKYGRNAANWHDIKWESIFTKVDDMPGPHIKVPMINLMVVETKDGISRRVALGQVALKIWIESKPKFQTFILG
ncbi:HET-domain-containing protein [Aspergillus sclerotiicarbonarius CBS 121057]|uniref:HET-domain-containing protein n=1 Tax=Aspergillus sclerotiicarbonarius (strain CBS 121057 / IBT 28362) TaxID=1448318 RepID=A0A319EXW8_ASPSB|nr:HET-domain-containing protein [Aspergillus sclerotiicarbonarius CBS 121057]